MGPGQEGVRRAHFKEIKNAMWLNEDHRAFGVVFEEKENEIRKTSVEERSSVRAKGESMDFFLRVRVQRKGKSELRRLGLFWLSFQDRNIMEIERKREGEENPLDTATRRASVIAEVGETGFEGA